MLNQIITKEIAFSTSAWDFIIRDFPGGWTDELKRFILSKVEISDAEIENLIARWKRYFLIYFDPCEGYFYEEKPSETYTIEQFINVAGDKLVINNSQGNLEFKCGKYIGVFFNNEMPKHPLVSQFWSTTIHAGYMIHDESDFPLITKAEF